MEALSNYERDLRTIDYFRALDQTRHGTPSEVPENLVRQMAEVLVSILQKVSDKAKCGAKWRGTKAWPGNAQLFDGKTDTAFGLGIDLLAGVYFSIGLSHFSELRHMDDSFWELLLSLKRLGRVKYDLMESPMEFASEKWEKTLTKRRKSSIFSMVVDYALVSRHEESDFGGAEIQLEWAFDSGGWQKLLPLLIEATQIGWRMNYMLYHSAYQKKRVSGQT